MNTRHCTCLIVGAGPGGYNLAAAGAERGADVVIIDRAEAGGTCLNRGCIPTKCLCATASALASARSASALGVKVDGTVSLDIEAARAHRDKTVDSLREDIGRLLEGCTVVNEEAHFDDDGHIVAGDTVYIADRTVIATGSRPSSLPVPGAELCLNSDDMLRLESVPESLCVIGGGVIGLEIASAYADFGSQVTVIEYLPEILPAFDADIARRLRSLLQRRGIKTITSAKVTAIEATEDGPRSVHYESRGKELSVNASCVLMAVGRRAVLPDGCEAAGIQLDRSGRIITDSDFRAAEGIYAIGDCAAGHPMLAHVAEAQAAILAGREGVDLTKVPSVIYTRPEAFATGMTEAQAREAGIDTVSAKIPVAANGYARATGATDGLIKAIADKTDGRIVGIHYCGPGADTLVGEAQTIVATGMTASRALATIHAHPTLTELLTAALAQLTRHP